MSKLRLIPKLQLKTASFNSKKLVLVVTRQFDEVIEIGDPVSQAKIFQDQLADELIFVNINKTNKDEVVILAEVVNKVSQEIFMPLTVGGGVTSIEDFRILLSNGADKIAINTVALDNPNLITEAAQKYGSQCVVVSIDYKKDKNGNYKVYKNCGQVQTIHHPLEWAKKAEMLGAGELLITSIDSDGQKNGLDLEITNQITQGVNIPVITSGGCGLSKDFSDGFLIGKASAVSAGTFFAHRDQNFIETRSHIINAGVNIRKQK